MNFPIGVIADCFKKDIRSSIETAARLGANGVQLYAVAGEISPEMSSSARSELRDIIASNGLVISALCGDLGTGGFSFQEKNEKKIERSKQIVDLAKELGTDIITTHIGVVPQDSSCERFAVMQKACSELAEYAHSVGAHFAVETGPEPALTLKGFLDSISCDGLGVNLDPANLKMVCDDDPTLAVYLLKDYIVHTHAKDGVMLYYKDPEIIYGLRQETIVTDDSFAEVPLGKGSVDFPEYLTALQKIGYTGFLTIEREVGENPEKDITDAIIFLKDVMSQSET